MLTSSPVITSSSVMRSLRFLRAAFCVERDASAAHLDADTAGRPAVAATSARLVAPSESESDS